MRSGEKGMKYIEGMIEKLSKKHMKHMELYGTGNEERLVGVLDTSKFDVFTYGIGDRSASVRIPTPVAHANG